MSTVQNNNRLQSAMTDQKRQPVDHPTIVKIQAKAAEFAKAMPKVMTPDRFMRVAIGAIRRNPKLLECDPLSLMGSLLIAAQLGLEVNTPLGHFYLIPRWNGKTQRNEADGQIGYKGWVELLNRTGVVKDLIAHVVYERDDFDYSLGDDEHIHHKPAMGDRGEAVAFYVIVKLTNGGVRRRVLSRHDVEQYRRRSKSANNGPWVTDYNAMALKTTFLREVPWLPLSLELREAVSYENAIEAQAKVVYKEGSNQLDYDLPEPAAQQLEYAPAEPAEDYHQQYQAEPEPEPVQERPRAQRRPAQRATAPPPSFEEDIQDVEPLPDAKPAPAPAPKVDAANPKVVQAVDAWFAQRAQEFEKWGVQPFGHSGALMARLYESMLAVGLVQPAAADTYNAKRIALAKLKPSFPELLDVLEKYYDALFVELQSQYPNLKGGGDAPWQEEPGANG